MSTWLADGAEADEVKWRTAECGVCGRVAEPHVKMDWGEGIKALCSRLCVMSVLDALEPEGSIPAENVVRPVLRIV